MYQEQPEEKMPEDANDAESGDEKAPDDAEGTDSGEDAPEEANKKNGGNGQPPGDSGPEDSTSDEDSDSSDLHAHNTLASKTLLSSRNTSIRNCCSRVTCCWSRSEPAPPPDHRSFIFSLLARCCSPSPLGIALAVGTAVRDSDYQTNQHQVTSHHGVGTDRSRIGLRRTEQCG